MIEPISAHIDIPSGQRLATTTFSPPGGGDKPDILLTHGLASNQQLWFDAATVLAERGHRVVTYDQRGHGQSSKPDAGYDMPTVAEDLVQLVHALGLDRPLIGGQSWGGNVVIEAAHRQPESVAGAVLVDGGFLHLRRRFPRWEDCQVALAPPPLAGTPLVDIHEWVESMAASWPPQGRAATLANFETRPDGTIAPWLTLDRHLTVLRGLWEHEPARRYEQIAVPVLIIAAADSDDTRAQKEPAVAEAVRSIPNCRARWFDPAHHDVHAQFPAEVADAIGSFLDDLAR